MSSHLPRGFQVQSGWTVGFIIDDIIACHVVFCQRSLNIKLFEQQKARKRREIVKFMIHMGQEMDTFGQMFNDVSAQSCDDVNTFSQSILTSISIKEVIKVPDISQLTNRLFISFLFRLFQTVFELQVRKTMNGERRTRHAQLSDRV